MTHENTLTEEEKEYLFLCDAGIFNDVDEDEKLARRLQQEEDEKATIIIIDTKTTTANTITNTTTNATTTNTITNTTATNATTSNTINTITNTTTTKTTTTNITNTPIPTSKILEKIHHNDHEETEINNLSIQELFVQFDQMYFKSALGGVFVEWSTRMTLCAGVCIYQGKGGMCAIRLSEPLLKFRPRSDLINTLLHEMIHAYLFVTANNRDRDGHGDEFQKLMNNINGRAGTHITIYHSFNDEVDYYRTHWWQCDGPCKNKPSMGIVKRAMNRAPGPTDYWWTSHQAQCGGIFTKIKEPEEYTQKKRKLEERKEKKEKKQKTQQSSNILTFFKSDTKNNIIEKPSTTNTTNKNNNNDNNNNNNNNKNNNKNTSFVNKPSTVIIIDDEEDEAPSKKLKKWA